MAEVNTESEMRYLFLEKDMDDRIFKILGRAVTKQDLDELYYQDLEALNKIQAGLDNPITSLAQIMAARKLQKVWRGKLARNQVKKELIFKAEVKKAKD